MSNSSYMTILSLFAVLALGTLVWLEETSAETESPAVSACYFYSGALEYSSMVIEDLPANLCNHLIYSFITVNEETWEVLLEEPEIDIDQEGFKRFVALKEQNPDLRTTLSVGGWGEFKKNYSALILYKERRDIFRDSVMDLMRTYGFDGLNLDWPYPGSLEDGGIPEDKENFLIWIQELREAFDAEGKGWGLTIAAPIKRNLVDGGYKVPELCSILDAVYLMGYDLRSTAQGVADVHSPLYTRPDLDQGDYVKINDNDGVLLWLEYGCPANKLVLGMPFYGVAFTLVDSADYNLHAPIIDDGVYKAYSYSQICSAHQNDDGWIHGYDESGMVPYTSKDTTWIGYDDMDSLKIKIDYLKSEGLLGAMTWSINDDDWENKCGYGRYPLAQVFFDNLKDYNVPK